MERRRHRRKHLYLVDGDSGQSIALTSGPYDHYLPSFSPDGKTIAFVTKRGKDPDRHLNWDIYTVEARAGGIEKQITKDPGTDLDPYWETRPAALMRFGTVTGMSDAMPPLKPEANCRAAPRS